MQSLGSVTVMVGLYVAVFYASRGGAVDWLARNPLSAQAISGVLFIALGVFTLMPYN